MPDTKLPKINKHYKPTDKEQDLRKWVYKRRREMEQAEERQRAEKIWDRGEKQWDQYRKEKDEYEWQADYFVPMTTSIVESTLAELVEQLPRPMILPRSPEDESRAKVMQAIFEYTWDIANGDEEMMKIMRGTLIHGTAIAQEYYLKDRRMVRDIVGLSEKANKRKQRNFMGKEKEVFEYDDCFMEWVLPQDVLVDEKSRDFNRGFYKARDSIRRYIMNYRDAEEFFKGDPNWDHLNNFRFVRPGGDTDYYQFYKPPQGINHEEEVEILWYWSRTPEDLLVIVVNDVVVRMGPNIFKHKQLPFARAIDVERLGRFYGKGEPELLESIQSEVNRLRNMTIDRHHLDIDKSFMIDPQLQVDEEDLIARPHGAIPGKSDQIQPIEYGDIPISVERTFRSIDQDKISVTGIDDRFQSVQKAPSTATEAAILKESTLKRIRMKLKNYESRFLVDIGRQRVSNILQFYTQPRLEKIVGEKNTDEFKRDVARLASQGMLEMREGSLFRKSFRNITLEGKELVFDERGEVEERKEPGFHFFEARPEFFVPMSSEGYDIRFEAGPALPVSKPLMQDKMRDAFDRIISLASPGLTNYDPEKLADELIIRPADLNPEELKHQEAVQEKNIEESRLALAVDLASQENDQVLSGGTIPELGTPFAPPAHTEVHIQFLRSEQMKSAPEEVYQRLLKHVVGEMEAINKRGASGGLPQGQGASQPTQTDGQQAQSGVPALIQGGGQVPTGQAIGNG